jgi:hypothetical protein
VVDVGGVDRLHQGVGVGERGEEHAYGVRGHLAGASEQFGPEHPRHALIADHERDLFAGQHLERGVRAVGPAR